MNTVKYNHRMTEEEIFRYAYHKMLEVDKEDLEDCLLFIYEMGYGEGWDHAVDAAYEDKGEVKFNPLP